MGEAPGLPEGTELAVNGEQQVCAVSEVRSRRGSREEGRGPEEWGREEEEFARKRAGKMEEDAMGFPMKPKVSAECKAESPLHLHLIRRRS